MADKLHRATISVTQPARKIIPFVCAHISITQSPMARRVRACMTQKAPETRIAARYVGAFYAIRPDANL